MRETNGMPVGNGQPVGGLPQSVERPNDASTDGVLPETLSMLSTTATEEIRSRWGGQTSNLVGAVYSPVWVRLPLSSATPPVPVGFAPFASLLRMRRTVSQASSRMRSECRRRGGAIARESLTRGRAAGQGLLAAAARMRRSSLMLSIELPGRPPAPRGCATNAISSPGS